MSDESDIEEVEAEVEGSEEAEDNDDDLADDDDDDAGMSDENEEEQNQQHVIATPTSLLFKGDVENDEEESIGIDDHTDDAEDEEDESTVKSHLTDGDAASAIVNTPSAKHKKSASLTPAETPLSASPPLRKRARQSTTGSSNRKGRAPSVAGLTIPFRTVKKAMKLDPDIPIVQNEAAIMITVATELLIKSLAKESLKNAKGRGRNTIRYEDVAEARTKKPCLAFLEILLP